MNRVDTIDPKDVTVIVAGNIIEGFGEEQIAIEREANQIGDEVGADGDVARWVTNDRRGTITITLLQTSRSNLFLSGLAVADELRGDAPFPTLIKDQRGNDIYFTADSWIRKMPRVVYKKGIEMRAWEIRSGHLNMFIGGAA